MLIHLSFANPLAPLLVLVGALALGGLAAVVIWCGYTSRRYRTREQYRLWRRAPLSGKFLGLLTGWGTLVLISALAYTAVDIAIYRANVEHLRADTSTGAALSESNAEELLGNRHGRFVTPVIPDARGVVGETSLLTGERLVLRKLGADTYRLSSR